jgi:hypothetical protein
MVTSEEILRSVGKIKKDKNSRTFNPRYRGKMRTTFCSSSSSSDVMSKTSATSSRIYDMDGWF